MRKSGAAAQGPVPRSELRTRVVSAVLMGLAALFLTWLGGIWFRILCVLIAAAILFEWTAMAKASTSALARRLSAVFMALAAIALVAIDDAFIGFLVLLALVAVALLVGARSRGDEWSAYGLAYATLPACALSLLRADHVQGLACALFLFAVVWASDVFAYFVGRALGGPKLAPRISPGKTWSGAIGGVLCAIILGTSVAFAFGTTVPAAALVMLIVVLSIVSQLGDLFESALKRRFGAKDSSRLIPGHGGIMDRVDGLVAAAAALYVAGAVIAGPDSPAYAFF